jgi:hypothetical protein
MKLMSMIIALCLGYCGMYFIDTFNSQEVPESPTVEVQLDPAPAGVVLDSEPTSLPSLDGITDLMIQNEILTVLRDHSTPAKL